MTRLLCVEDSSDDVDLIAMALRRADPSRRYELQRVDDAQGFVSALDQQWDAILCDFSLPRFSPYEALEILAAHGDSTPLVVVTRAIGEEAAVHVLRSGARDYVAKDKLGTLPQVLDRITAEHWRTNERERLANELDLAYARLKQLSARLVMAQEQERTLVSRELHDQLGQTLTALVIHLHASRRTPDAQAATRYVDAALEIAQSAIEQVKSLSFSLRPAQLDLLGLVAAVQSTAQRIAAPAGIQCVVISRGNEPVKPVAAAPVALRLIQEGLTNIVRHSGATLATVRVRFLARERIGVLILDNGVGFDKADVLDGQPSVRNVGLYGMMERTELAGGRLHIRTRPGHGVAIRAVL